MHAGVDRRTAAHAPAYISKGAIISLSHQSHRFHTLMHAGVHRRAAAHAAVGRGVEGAAAGHDGVGLQGAHHGLCAQVRAGGRSS